MSQKQPGALSCVCVRECACVCACVCARARVYAGVMQPGIIIIWSRDHSTRISAGKPFSTNSHISSMNQHHRPMRRSSMTLL